MSVIRNADELAADGAYPHEVPDTCFFCIEVLSFPIIHWSGSSHIYMHPECAVELGSKLVADALSTIP